MSKARADGEGAPPRVQRPPGGGQRGLLLGTGAALLLLLVAAIGSGWRAHGRPFPGLFVDPYGSYSAVDLPAWNASSLGLNYPMKLVAVDGVAIPSGGRGATLPARRAEAL